MHPPTTNVNKGKSRNSLTWELHALGRWDRPNQGKGTLALRAIDDCAKSDFSEESNGNDAVCSLICKWTHSESTGGVCSVNFVTAAEKEEKMPIELICVLSRIMVQCAASDISSKIFASGSGEDETVLRMALPLLEGVCKPANKWWAVGRLTCLAR
jgi:hypothetical protein